jgi:hypothetical protein
MGLLVVLRGGTFQWYGRTMGSCVSEVEQTESGFCCIVLHEVMGARDLQNIILHRRVGLFIGRRRRRRRRRCC